MRRPSRARSTSPRPLSLYVIGWGRVGSALGTQARAQGVDLVGVDTRDPARRARARRAMAHASRPMAEAGLVALAIPDGAVRAVAEGLVGRLRPGQVVFHCAGSLDLRPLDPVLAARARPASLHPFCSIASAASPLRGATCALDGAPRARALLRRLALAVGMKPFARTPSDRISYHLAAVLTVASAGVAAVASEALLRRSGGSAAEARTALGALLRSVAFNVEQTATGAALTGPFARGDVERIRLQLAALDGMGNAADLYRAVGVFTAELASGLTDERKQDVLRVLRLR